MSKIDALIVAIQREILVHDWDSFAVPVDGDEPNGRKVVVSGVPRAGSKAVINLYTRSSSGAGSNLKQSKANLRISKVPRNSVR
jgi:hypothetical protein